MLTDQEIKDRQEGLGASDAGAYCGVGRFKSMLQLYMEKRGEIQLSEEETELMYWGKVFEEPICQRWSELTGFKIRNAPKRTSKDVPYFFVNVDRMIVNHPRGPGYLEAKNYEHLYVRSMDDMPEDAYLQGQHGLFVTGWEWGAFAVRSRGRMVDPEALIFDRDQATIDKMVAAGRWFWDECVLKGKPPEIDGSDSCAAMIAKLYPKDDGRELTLDDPSLIEKVTELQVLRSEREALEAAETALMNRLKYRMNDASLLHIPGWGKISWKKSKDSPQEVVDLKKLRSDYAKAYEECVSRTTKLGSRRFLVQPDKDTL